MFAVGFFITRLKVHVQITCTLICGIANNVLCCVVYCCGLIVPIVTVESGFLARLVGN